MIGAGILEEECIQLIKLKNLESNISMLGFMENPYGILSNAKVLCITSDWEGFGLVAVEALSLGVPVLATSVGGLTGIVTPDCGALCESDEMFIDEINKLISSIDYRQKKSRNAFQRAGFLNNIDAYTETINKVYQA